tara:strand:- start:1 stop:789 length:789 start_codon:yes stop_codon:yes gene_type:complete
MNKLLKTAISAALEAGKEILKIYNSNDFDIELKRDNSPLTLADKVSHKIIINYLNKTNIPVLSEEGKNIKYHERKNWEYLWIIDPIDGTKEFIKRNGEFTINIALIKDQNPVIGVVFVPEKGVLYFSNEFFGSAKVNVNLECFEIDNLIKTSKILPIKNNRTEFTIVASRSHLTIETENFIKKMKKKHGSVKLISKGSSLKLCMVAEGKADCYPRFAPTMEWDTAAGQAICNYAGFQVLDCKTMKPMLYNREVLLNNWFLVK